MGFAGLISCALIGSRPAGSYALLAGILALIVCCSAVLVFRLRSGSAVPPGCSEPWLLLALGLAPAAGSARLTLALAPDASLAVVLGAALQLGSYPILALGLGGLVRARWPARHTDVFAEAGLAAAASGLLLRVLVADPSGGLGRPTGLMVFAIARCSLDAGLVVIMARLAFVRGEKPQAERFLGAAFGLLFLAHLLALLSAGGQIRRTSTAVEVMMIAAFGCWARAGSHPALRLRSDTDSVETASFRPSHVPLLIGALLVAPTVIAVRSYRHAVTSPAIAVGASLLTLITGAYLISLLRDRDITEHGAHHDPLTHLPNKTLFEDRLRRALAQARRHLDIVAVMFVDLDHFKHINDSLGHAAGDLVLSEAARRLTTSLRDEDTVARIGGDEFAILLPRVETFDGAIVVAEKLMKLFRQPFTIEGEKWFLTPSIGIAIYPSDGTDAAQLIANADTAMYRAKEAGRDAYEVFTPVLHERAHERVRLEAALHNALERGELVVFYQPKYDVVSGSLVGAEALVRWQHPDRGLLAPGEFVALAEQTGQVVKLGETVLYEACRQNRAWQKAGLRPVPVAVNVSARQFRHAIVDSVASVLRRTGLGSRWLEVELTESAAAEGLVLIGEALNELRSMGVRCSIDDFGTGYCGLSYLSRLPIDVLKIDKSFIQMMPAHADSAIVAAIISMAHSLKLTVVAEGVETLEQLELLTAYGCDHVQGYLFSRPLPAADFQRLLASQTQPTPAAAARS